jgi:hypothetical protein
VAVIIGNIGVLHATTGGTEVARQHHLQALTTLSSIYGPDHPFTIRAAARLADVT